MRKLVVEGASPLYGEVKVQGAKNSALPILAATLMCEGESCLVNCPRLSDVEVAVKILRYLGCEVYREGGAVIIDSADISKSDIPESLMREMRSSIIFLGAILAKTGKAKLSLPGGCELGPRPIDLHLSSLKMMGVSITEEHGRINCHVKDKLRGASISLPIPSVGATENIMLAAATAEGTTVISNAAREPEIADLASYLNDCGARIKGAGESTVTIEGVEKLYGAYHRIIPDRIEAATFMAAAAVTGGSITLLDIAPEHIETLVPVVRESGCTVKLWDDEMTITAPERLRAVKYIRTMPYPGFPTDAQAPFMAMMAKSGGTTVFVENIFSGRYKHINELIRLGADIKVQDRVAVVEGVDRLSGAVVEACDLRGGAALVVAGLAAEGITEITQIHHIDRGYEDIEQKLSALGAKIYRI